MSFFYNKIKVNLMVNYISAPKEKLTTYRDFQQGVMEGRGGGEREGGKERRRKGESEGRRE